MKKYFLDVGGHKGETLEEVLKPKYLFDEVHCFEPIAECCDYIREKFSPYIESGKLFVQQFGLADFDGEQLLYGDKEGGASLFSDKVDIDTSLTASCTFINASTFIEEHVSDGDLTIMKLNCEGGEALILKSLLDSGSINKLSNIMVDFDIRKIPSRSRDENELVQKMTDIGYKSYTTPKDSMIGLTHQDRINFWLSNLPFAEQFMQVSTDQKLLSLLPFSLRRKIQKTKKRHQKRQLAKNVS
ncbi:hypothetical protein GZ77_24150 [Endozoicomonas montiporae]|uniref:Methyltransferase FkbM domain-containing protein n=2 Tax=Endozoicomonas montiporae TaxID=1027273 RepID=A0A081MZJ6_9GAMM|nr:FkbM family methyltransferase [Endozoicomonas montiporae]AMO54699.1 hypothetical protein EZMO1_0448 [Endozoicomonas montiporae CL-33]KEQ11619.1 hypothetical protein GZ77_24150 [Endozoicomonas montiporae]